MHRLLIVLLIQIVAMSCSSSDVSKENQEIDWQGHRGARGVFPENSIPGFLKALEFPISTLELDCVISQDSQVVVSHEPWFSSKFSFFPNGIPVTEQLEDSTLIWGMPYSEVRKFSFGKNGHPDFPQQEKRSCYKPTLQDVLVAVKVHCQQNARDIPQFNIEIKSRKEWDGVKTPEPELFAKLVYEVVKGDLNKVCIQSFDIRALQAIKAIDSEITTALLVENEQGFSWNLEQLGYQPEIYSPYHVLVDPQLVTQVHAKQMKIIPWTINKTKRMKELMAMGVDGIITDYPNLIELVDSVNN